MDFELIPCIGKRRPWVRYAYSPFCNSMLSRAIHRNSNALVDFVHIHGLFSQITHNAAKICQKFSIPYAIRPTGALDELPLQKGATFLKSFFLRYQLRGLLEDAHFIQSTSSQESKSLENLGFNLRLREIPLGISQPDWSPAHYQQIFAHRFPDLQNKPFILCLSRIHPIKRLDLALKAFKILSEKTSECHLVIAGTQNAYQSQLLNEAQQLDISLKVHFVGFLQDELKTGAFFSARAFLQTSEHENFGVTVLEALAHGLRVVCTPNVAAGEHLTKCNGGLISTDEPESIADKLFEILKEHSEEQKLALSKRVFHLCSWDSVAQQLYNCYKDPIAPSLVA